MKRQLDTPHGTLTLPAFLPVTTFGGKYPLDDLVRPYLKRFAPAMMVSHFYAQKMKGDQGIPVFIDSGGFASLFKDSEILDHGEVAAIRAKDSTVLNPGSVLAFQEEHADIGATLDFVVPPDMDIKEAQRRQDLTIRNALWALKNRSRPNFRLFASIQAWDEESARRILDALAPYPFDGFALGGMVPRISQPKVIFEIVGAIRKVDPSRPLHVFGIGQPRLIKGLFEYGVDSVDSSTFVQQAAGKKYLQPEKGSYAGLDQVDDPISICACRVCQTFEKTYLSLEGELNNMALALHNLAATQAFIFGDENYDR